MKIYKKIAVMPVLALVFTVGCTNTAQESPAEVEPEVTDAVYLAIVREHLPQLEPVADETLISTANDLCDFFESEGVTENTVIGYASGMVEGGEGLFDYGDAGAFMGASAAAYCPAVNEQFQSLDLTGGSPF